jgi:hypothetical protein
MGTNRECGKGLVLARSRYTCNHTFRVQVSVPSSESGPTTPSPGSECVLCTPLNLRRGEIACG